MKRKGLIIGGVLLSLVGVAAMSGGSPASSGSGGGGPMPPPYDPSFTERHARASLEAMGYVVSTDNPSPGDAEQIRIFQAGYNRIAEFEGQTLTLNAEGAGARRVPTNMGRVAVNGKMDEATKRAIHLAFLWSAGAWGNPREAITYLQQISAFLAETSDFLIDTDWKGYVADAFYRTQVELGVYPSLQEAYAANT